MVSQQIKMLDEETFTYEGYVFFAHPRWHLCLLAYSPPFLEENYNYFHHEKNTQYSCSKTWAGKLKR